MRRWLLLLAIGLIVSLGTARGERWYKLYDQAKDDIDHQRWESAIRKLEEAVAQKAESGASVRGEGTKRVAYFPYYLMGKAYYHLGRYGEAVRFFNRESHFDLPGRIATEISVYQRYIRAIDEDHRRLAQFNQMVERAHALRAGGAFLEAVTALRGAREYHPAEFERRNLGRTVEALLTLERNRVEEKARRDRETKFQSLFQQASQREKQGRLRDADHLLLEADRLIPGRSDVTALRKRIKDREDRYARHKQAALTNQSDGKLVQALDALQQASEADPERFNSEKLSSLTASLSRQIEIERHNQLRARKVSTTRPSRQDDRGLKSRIQKPAVRDRQATMKRMLIPNPEAVRRAVLAAYQGPPADAVRVLEEMQSNGQLRNAQLQSSIGIAYARLSFLSVDPIDSEKFREKATQHFRSARALDPGHRLNSRLVAPQIIDLFAASR